MDKNAISMENSSGALLSFCYCMISKDEFMVSNSHILFIVLVRK